MLRPSGSKLLKEFSFSVSDAPLSIGRSPKNNVVVALGFGEEQSKFFSRSIGIIRAFTSNSYSIVELEIFGKDEAPSQRVILEPCRETLLCQAAQYQITLTCLPESDGDNCPTVGEPKRDDDTYVPDESLEELLVSGLRSLEQISVDVGYLRTLTNQLNGQLEVRKELDNSFWQFSAETRRTVATISLIVGLFFAFSLLDSEAFRIFTSGARQELLDQAKELGGAIVFIWLGLRVKRTGKNG
jgi:hypothetical protein